MLVPEIFNEILPTFVSDVQSMISSILTIDRLFNTEFHPDKHMEAYFDARSYRILKSLSVKIRDHVGDYTIRQGCDSALTIMYVLPRELNQQLRLPTLDQAFSTAKYFHYLVHKLNCVDSNVSLVQHSMDRVLTLLDSFLKDRDTIARYIYESFRDTAFEEEPLGSIPYLRGITAPFPLFEEKTCLDWFVRNYSEQIIPLLAEIKSEESNTESEKSNIENNVVFCKTGESEAGKSEDDKSEDDKIRIWL